MSGIEELEPGDDRFMLLTALLAFHGAKIRFEDHEHDTAASHVFIPLAEALWWAVSVDEGFELIDGDNYQQFRDAEYLGMVLRGVKYARNRTGHQRALPVEMREGMGFPVTFPMRFWDFVWLPVSKLRAPAQPDPKGEQMYVEHLAGTAARLTLSYCASWFARAQNRPGSGLNFGPIVKDDS